MMAVLRKTSLVIIMILVAACGGSDPRQAALAQLPPLMLWAWERPEDLRFLDPSRTGVAYLAGTLDLSEGRVELRPRLQPLRVPDECAILAVIRIESGFGGAAGLTDRQRERAVDAILAATDRDGVLGLQIDFDAVVSERDAYRRLFHALRAAMPKTWPLSITALASWCLDDNWMRGLPIDEAVPMLFRMGIDAERVRHGMRSGRDFGPEAARLSYGLSTDEPIPAMIPGRRIYLFHPKTWDSGAYESMRRTLQQLPREEEPDS